MGTKHSVANRREGLPRVAAAGRVIALFNGLEGCSRALRAAVSRLAAKHELAATQLLALWACGETDAGVGQSNLAARIGVSPAQASALVEYLRKRGLVKSHRTAADRRRQNWTIADAGRSVLSVAVEELANLADRIATSVPEYQLGRFEVSLNHLTAAVAQSNAPDIGLDGVPRLRVISPETGDAGRDEPDAIRASEEVAK